MKKKYIMFALVIIVIICFILLISCKTKEIQRAETTNINQGQIEVSLRVALTDYTENNKPNPEVWIEGTGSWYPDIEFGGDVFIPDEPFSNDNNKIYIYPDGREGNEIIVEVVVSDEMISESVKDTIHIEIYDDIIKVWGTSIEEFEKDFTR
jgi:hypothetical protein